MQDSRFVNMLKYKTEMVGTYAILIFSVFSGFGLAFFAPLIHKYAKALTGWLLALLPASLFTFFAAQIPQIIHGETIAISFPYLKDLNLDNFVNWSFYLDGLSLLFALLISGFGVLIIIYAGSYLKNHTHLGRFYFYLLMFMASMLGVVLASNLITLFIFWELTSLSSYFLIGFNHEKGTARKAALQALLVTASGGLAMLAGFIMIGFFANTFEITELLSNPAVIKDSGLYLPIFILLTLGAFTKSAQWPFHYWLPNAMEAPTPVSAYLHSATMVKAGIYLLARFSPLMSETMLWTGILGALGVLTAITAALLALKSNDLKRILAYSTLLALGTLTMLLGINAVAAAMIFLLAHSLYKGALFMSAGSIDLQAGSREINKLSGLIKYMPVTFVTVLLASVSMAGLPFALGFVAKELIYKDLLLCSLLLGGMLAANIGLFAVSAVVIIKPFLGKFNAVKKKVTEAPISMWLGPIILAAAGIAFGIFPHLLNHFMSTATSAVLGKEYHLHLHMLPEKFDTALLLSIITISLGIVTYFLYPVIFKGLNNLSKVLDIGPARWYEWGLQGLQMVARNVTKYLQTGNLRNDLLFIFIFTITLVSVSLWRYGIVFPSELTDVQHYSWVLPFMIIIGSLNAVRARTRLTAITSLGVVGFSVALIFIVFAAPDLAITQFMVETLIVIIMALVMIHLPVFQTTEAASRFIRLRDAFIATLGGLAITLIMLAVLSQPFNSKLNEYFEHESVPSGQGHNIVNVILVDFRGIDTMGEITVLAIAAVGVFALLRPKGSKVEQNKE